MSKVHVGELIYKIPRNTDKFTQKKSFTSKIAETTKDVGRINQRTSRTNFAGRFPDNVSR